MKLTIFFVLPILLLGSFTMSYSIPSAFADNSEVTIEPAAGSGSPGCEETSEGCFTPSTATVDVGGKVIFSNTDSAAHTFTSGDSTDADSVGAVFDSSLAMAGSTFEWTATEAGEQPYFCIVHPWMAGLIIVEAEAEEMMEKTHEDEEMMEMETMTVGDVDVTMSPPIEGSADASVTIVEFGDYQCPKCDQWFQNEKPTITTDYIDTNKAKLYFVDFPFLGEDSDNAANASYCAEDQGMYWEYHSALYNNQGGINEGWANIDALKQFAADLGLDTPEFDECVDSSKHADRVAYNKAVGTSRGVEGTPVFIIIDSDGSMERIEGPQSSDIFADVIDGMLGEAMASTEVGGIDVSQAAPLEGSEDATVSIIEFGDYQCPKCDQWFQNEKPTIESDYLSTGKANLYFLDFTFLGEDSDNAANASYCAEDQGMYWEYHSALYNNQGGINEGWANIDALKQFAANVGLDTIKFDSCLDSGKYADRISHNTGVGASHGVEGTPAFFIVGSDGSIERIDGPQSSDVFAEIIDEMLGEPMEEAMAETMVEEEMTVSETSEKEGGGCLIATAAYGSELAPQVQFLREIRDNTVMSTASGAAFMTGFNQLYYSFSPTIADLERENPMFQQAVRAFITPMVSTLSIMTLADDGSEMEVLGLGISVIALNLGIYIAAPSAVVFTVGKRLKSRK